MEVIMMDSVDCLDCFFKPRCSQAREVTERGHTCAIGTRRELDLAMGSRSIEEKHIRKNGAWWRQQRVLSGKELCNELGCVPSLTMFKVMRKYKGLTIQSLPCALCGIKIEFTRVAYCNLDFALGYPMLTDA